MKEQLTALAATGVLATGVGCSTESQNSQEPTPTPPHKTLEVAQEVEFWSATEVFQPGPDRELKIGEKVVGICVLHLSGESQKLSEGVMTVLREDELVSTPTYSYINGRDRNTFEGYSEVDLSREFPRCEDIDLEKFN